MTRKANDRCCETCRYDLGGGYDNCKINVEAECAAGGFEAWEPKEERFNDNTSKDDRAGVRP